jgi:geranylgeranyl diphosphate synthase type II
MRRAEELRELVETYLRSLDLSADLGALRGVLGYVLESGGKRVRPVLCLAVCESAGGDVERALPAAAAVELVHSFSLVHDDLPALDDDDERRGRPSAHVAFGEGVALLAGDALLAEALRLALTYADPALARELVDATLAMIGGQHRDITGDNGDFEALHRLKTGALFGASVGLGLRAASVPEGAQATWRAFGDDVGLLFQIVDDVLDGDGYAERVGRDGARALSSEVAARALGHLDGLSVDTTVLRDLVGEMTFRTG